MAPTGDLAGVRRFLTHTLGSIVGVAILLDLLFVSVFFFLQIKDGLRFKPLNSISSVQINASIPAKTIIQIGFREIFAVILQFFFKTGEGKRNHYCNFAVN